MNEQPSPDRAIEARRIVSAPGRRPSPAHDLRTYGFAADLAERIAAAVVRELHSFIIPKEQGWPAALERAERSVYLILKEIKHP